MFSIAAGETTDVVYTFETDGVVIDLAEGRLVVTIDVREIGGSGGSGGAGGVGGAGGGSGGGLTDRDTIAAELCERFDEVPICDPLPDCTSRVLSDFESFDTILVGCVDVIDAFFACLAGAPPFAFECIEGAPTFVFFSGACVDEENAFIEPFGDGSCEL